MPLWNPREDQWWHAPRERMFEAYYMTLRIHYGMPASEAFAYAKRAAAALGIGESGGFVGKIREALWNR